MLQETTFNLIGETLMYLAGQPAEALGGALWGCMGVFSLGEML